VSVAETEAHTSASIGISVYPVTEPNPIRSSLMPTKRCTWLNNAAETAFSFSNAGTSVFSRERLDFESDLRRALSLKQFEVHYQPKVDIASGRVNSVEALLRWRHPTRGLVGPSEFIPLAEESGLMFSIGEWVLREACRQARQWQSEGLAFIRIAVNISPIHFLQPRFLDIVRSALWTMTCRPNTSKWK